MGRVAGPLGPITVLGMAMRLCGLFFHMATVFSSTMTKTVRGADSIGSLVMSLSSVAISVMTMGSVAVV